MDRPRVVAVFDDGKSHHLGELVGGLDLHSGSTRFAMDADPHFDFIVTENKSRLSSGRDRAGGERQAHAAPAGVYLTAKIGDLGEIVSLFRTAAGNRSEEH